MTKQVGNNLNTKFLDSTWSRSDINLPRLHLQTEYESGPTEDIHSIISMTWKHVLPTHKARNPFRK